jgi:hypothetical protein
MVSTPGLRKTRTAGQGNTANGTERRDFPATWRPTERAYRTIHLVAQSTYSGSARKPMSGRARRTTKEQILDHQCTRRSASPRDMRFPVLLSDGAHACKATNRPSSELLIGKDEYEQHSRSLLEPLPPQRPRLPISGVAESGR